MDSSALDATIRIVCEYYIYITTNNDPRWFILGFILSIFMIVVVVRLYTNRLPMHGEENEKEMCQIDYTGILRSKSPILEILNKRRKPLSIEYFEKWRKPVLHFGNNDKRIKDFFENNLKNINEDEWNLSCKIVDELSKMLVCEMREAANKSFPGLYIGKTLRKQGSSREGLKVCDPFEFDLLLPFHLENVQAKIDVVFDNNGCIIPGLFKMKIMDSEKLPSWWTKCGLVSYVQEKAYINTSHFQKKVFASLLDQSTEEINKQLKKLTENSKDEYKLVRQVNSPSLKITIKGKNQNGLEGLLNTILHLGGMISRQEGIGHSSQVNLEVDLVPGILLSIDNYPKSMFNQKGFVCERYGVMKWVNKKNPAILSEDGNLIWRNSTCGYEKCMFDIVQRYSSPLYVMTACRLLKGELRKLASNSHNQLGSVVKSYHLKNFCLYCILFLTIHDKPIKLTSVTEAMGYFIEFMRHSLEAGNLPHFFHGNPHLSNIFPVSVFGKEKTKYNMFAMNSEETLIQARIGFKDFMRKLQGLYLERKQLDYKKIKLFSDHLQRQ